VLSVAADPLDPLGEAAETLHALAPRYPTWTADYYHQVAARVDQIAVMTYGSAFPTPALYGSFVRMETAALLRSVDPGVRLFVGIPTYDVVGWGFLHHAETLSAAVRGIREGVVGFSTRRVDDLSGAIYADWTTTGADWRAYERAWLRPGAASL
ncbi:MAG TPA: hypothetical protein VK132_11010, partial [Gemmatimonadales bacterium]|nr:hypothetical protein [Gemmatimonadales bacterium]